MAPAIVDIALVANERFFPGLWATVVSLMSAAADLRGVVIHVVDGGIADRSWDRLVAAVESHPQKLVFKRLPFDADAVGGLRLPPGKHPLAYARLLLPELLACDSVLYLDSDLVVCADVTALRDVDLQGAAAAAVLNEDGATMSLDFSDEQCSRFGVASDDDYFNTGVMIMNLARWRNERVADACVALLNEHEFPRVDQSAINLVLQGKIKSLDRRWNRLANRIDHSEWLADSPNCVVHFTTSKPWLVRQETPAAAFFEKFCKDTGCNLPERPLERRPQNQPALAQAVRGASYAMASAWCALRGNPSKADAYRVASDYWLNYCATRRARVEGERKAITAINNRNLRPEWLQTA